MKRRVDKENVWSWWEKGRTALGLRQGLTMDLSLTGSTLNGSPAPPFSPGIISGISG